MKMMKALLYGVAVLLTSISGTLAQQQQAVTASFGVLPRLPWPGEPFPEGHYVFQGPTAYDITVIYPERAPDGRIIGVRKQVRIPLGNRVQQEGLGVVPPVWPGPRYDPATNPTQYVFLTSEGGALVVYPPHLRGSAQPYVRVPLLNQARPQVTVEMSRDLDGTFKYLYTIANGADAGNAIGTFALVGYPGDERLEMRYDPPPAERKRWSGAPQQGPWTLIARQVKLPGAPTGAYMRWTRDELRSQIEPGQSLGGFRIKSSFRPGFTTGFVAILHQRDLDPRWGEEVYSQLRFLNRTEWKDQPLLTFGPRYAGETGRDTIAREFLAGLEQWIKDGNLAADSPFVRHLSAGLRAMAAGGEARSGSAPPATSAYERMLLDAVHLTLGEGTGGGK